MSSNGKRQGPDFICIGAQKAGTTWLYDQLVHHPQVWLPVIKELHYFNFEKPNPLLREKEVYPWGSPGARFRFLKDRPSIKTLRWLLKYNYGRKGPEWYRSLFPNIAGKIAGELTPAYSTLDEEGVEFVRETVPENTKVFVILRDPVERIWSGAKMDFRWRKESTEELSRNSEKELLRPTHLLRSAYSTIVPLWKSRFGERFRVFFYDDLEADPASFLSEVLDFLDVDTAWTSPSLRKRSNSDRERLAVPPAVEILLRQALEKEVSYVLSQYPEKELDWRGKAIRDR